MSLLFIITFGILMAVLFGFMAYAAGGYTIFKSSVK
jgi:hypothetical protein